MAIWVVTQNNAPIGYLKTKAAAKKLVARRETEYHEAVRLYYATSGRRSNPEKEKFFLNWEIENPPPDPALYPVKAEYNSLIV